MSTRHLVTAFLVCSAIALPLPAQSVDIGAFFTSTSVGETSDPDGEIDFDDGSGWTISATYFWTNSIATELAYTQVKSDGRVSFPDGERLDIGSLDLQTTTLIAQWHLRNWKLFQPYVGAGAAQIAADSLESADLAAGGISAVDIDDEWTWCANAGVNVTLTRHLALAFDARYIPYEPDSAAASDLEPVPLELNPLFLSAGLRLRF